MYIRFILYLVGPYRAKKSHLIPQALQRGVPSSASLHKGVFLVQHDAHIFSKTQHHSISKNVYRIIEIVLDIRTVIEDWHFSSKRLNGLSDVMCGGCACGNGFTID